jgi:hypothetical protein
MIYRNSSQVQTFPPPGYVVSVPLLLLFRHKGIVSERIHLGKPLVISGSGRAGKVCEEPWDNFAAGSVPQIDGYPSKLPAHEVVRRARQTVGKAYQVLQWNCDHVVAFAHRQKLESRQVHGAIAVALLALTFLAAKQK